MLLEAGGCHPGGLGVELVFRDPMPAELNGKTASGVGAKSEKKSTVSACLAVMDVGALCGLEGPG